MGQLKYHNGTTWVPVEASTADYSALVLNELLQGTIDGVNKTFTTSRNFSMVSIYKNGVKMMPGVGNDYTVTGANTIVFTTAPAVTTPATVLSADYSTSASYTVTGTNSFVRKQAVAGTINGVNKDFVTAAAYVGGTLEVFVNGVRQKIADVTETNPGAGMFTLDTAPLSTPLAANVEVAYMTGGIASGNADTVDSFHASQTPTPNTIPVTNANGGIPASFIDWSTFANNIKMGANTATSTPGNGTFNLDASGAKVTFTVATACVAFVTVDIGYGSTTDFEFLPRIYLNGTNVVTGSYHASASGAGSANRAVYRGVSGLVSLPAGANTISAGVTLSSSTSSSAAAGAIRVTAIVLGNVTA